MNKALQAPNGKSKSQWYDVGKVRCRGAGVQALSAQDAAG